MGMSKDAIYNIIMKELNPTNLVDKTIRGLRNEAAALKGTVELDDSGKMQYKNPTPNKRYQQEAQIREAYHSSKNPREFKAKLLKICASRKGLRGQFSGTKTAITRGLKKVDKQELESQQNIGTQYRR
tara:strand:+ start:577 stop:960 length:384 start_codon:yes stop_codon:yes gene_type:complete